MDMSDRRAAVHERRAERAVPQRHLPPERPMTEDLGTHYLRLERRGAVGWCIIDRPEARNALTAGMYFGIRRAVDLVNADPDLAALIITGTGDVFAPGGELAGWRDESELDVGRLIGSDALPFKPIRLSRAPVVSAVNGICQGRSDDRDAV